MFTEEELEEYEIPYEALEVEWLDERRWYTIKQGVFSVDDKFYAIKWMDPASEVQEDQPMWYDFPVEGVEVEQREVTVTEWVAVE